MHPVLFKWGSFTVYSYGFMILLGLICAWWVVKRLSKPLGLDSDGVSELFLWCILGVFIGGKLFFYLEDPKLYWAHPEEMFKDLGRGFVFYGSFLVTIGILIWWFRRKKLNAWAMMDIIGLGGAITHGFGKIGCFLSGCCHGKVCHNRWGVVFSDANSFADPKNVPLYPVQLFDALIIFVTVAVMWVVYKRKTFDGQVFLIYGIGYAVGRFITEFYRGDEARGYLFDGLLTHSQFIAILVGGGSMALYFWRRKKSKKKNLNQHEI